MQAKTRFKNMLLFFEIFPKLWLQRVQCKKSFILNVFSFRTCVINRLFYFILLKLMQLFDSVHRHEAVLLIS